MKRVLIVDDAEFMRMTIKTMLERNGFEVIGEAHNGREGVNEYKRLHPDIVTMDITMPEISGIDALKLIMEFDTKANVVMLSAMGQENLIREAVLNGAKSFLVKPFKEEQVIKTLNQIQTNSIRR
jgi:two-component system chemotaxis response regulator CheY